MLALARDYALVDHLGDQPAHHWTGTGDHFRQGFVRQFGSKQNSSGILDPEPLGELGENDLQTLAKRKAKKPGIEGIRRGPRGVQCLD